MLDTCHRSLPVDGMRVVDLGMGDYILTLTDIFASYDFEPFED